MHQLKLIPIILLAGLALAQPPGGFGRRGGGRSGSGGGLGNPPLAVGKSEQQILDALEKVSRHLNVPQEDGRLIRLLVEATGAKSAVEIGTSTGYSGLWFTLGLRSTGGKLTTFELDPERARGSRETFREAGVADIVTVVEGDAHQRITFLKGPIDIVFIDADKEGYRDYLDKLLPLVRPGGLILAHNIGDRSQNPEYVDAVVKNPALETILLNSQMVVTMKKR